MSSSTFQTQNTWLESIRRWASMAGWPSVLSALLSLFTLMGLSLLYRELRVAEAGMLALLISLSDILRLVALLGLGTTITRQYAASEPGVFDWPIDLLRTAGYAFPIVGLGTVAAVLVYGFSLLTGLFLLVLATFGTLVATTFSMLNARGHYAWSAFLVRAPNAYLFVFALIGLLSLSELKLTGVLLGYLFTTVFTLGLGVGLLFLYLPRGSRRITRKQRFEGLPFMTTATTDMLTDQGLVAVAGWILPLSQVAAFAAVAVLIRPFRLARSVLAVILAPDLLRFKRSSYRRLIAVFWLFALVCGLATAILGPPIASRFYGGRYEEAISWIPYLSLAGVFLIGALPARVDLSVRGPIRTVRKFAIVYLASMLAALGLTVAGMYAVGAVFLAFGVVLMQVTECGVAYGFWISFRRTEGWGASSDDVEITHEAPEPDSSAARPLPGGALPVRHIPASNSPMDEPPAPSSDSEP